MSNWWSEYVWITLHICEQNLQKIDANFYVTLTTNAKAMLLPMQVVSGWMLITTHHKKSVIRSKFLFKKQRILLLFFWQQITCARFQACIARII